MRIKIVPERFQTETIAPGNTLRLTLRIVINENLKSKPNELRALQDFFANGRTLYLTDESPSPTNLDELRKLLADVDAQEVKATGGGD